MGKREFIASQRTSWEELEKLLTRINAHGIKSLEESELLKLGSLYRMASTDLSRARAAEPFGDVTFFLNRLVANTHAVIYTGRSKPFHSFLTFLKEEFPSLVRKHSRIVLLSALMFLLPVMLGYYWMLSEPRSMYLLFPQIASLTEEMASQIENEPGLLASGQITPETMPLFSSWIIVNNVRIAISAFAFGITFGLGTIYMLIMNGVMLGGVSYLFFSRPADYVIYFLAGVFPHAVLELTAIVLSGTAGFLIAGALIMPGNLRRVDALRIRGRDAVRIMYGVIIMLIIAGLIEGFITPIHIEGRESIVNWLKISGSIIVGLLMIAYFSFAGRKERNSRVPS